MVEFLRGYTGKFVSRWLILLMDVIVSAISFILATFIRFNFELTYVDMSLFKYHLALVIAVRACCFFVAKTHRGIVRHTSLEDGLSLFKAVFSSSAVLFLLSIAFGARFSEYLHIPLSIIIIDFFVLLVSLMLIRLSIKSAYDYVMKTTNRHRQQVIIYGAGLLGMMAKNTLLKDKKKNIHILCFIDDNPSLVGKSIEGVSVLSRSEACRIYLSDRDMIEDIEVIFAIGSISISEKNKIIDDFLELGVTLKSIPPAEQWINGELSASQIRNVKIEDLLDREQIKLNNEQIEKTVFGKAVMITGAAGSIGSEIVRQLIPFKPQKLILIDQWESGLYDLETELKRLSSGKTDHVEIHIEVCNIVDEPHIRNLFEQYKPNIVFHAAAYKHVPLMEKNPFKAFEVNVLGTKLVADLASEYRVEKFVFISTDKAVNPTNVMGATKRLAEIYVQGLDTYNKNQTQFIVTRFGNVLGSNGSVIPLFKKQIEKGGPVTVTHPEIIRYFMTIPEACQLVLEAGVMGKGGEIFVFDMGSPVKIDDLARKMIRLSGMDPNKDIAITYTGLREGEKLYEELLGVGENELPTHHSKIKIAKLEGQDYLSLNAQLQAFSKHLGQKSNLEIVSFLKQEIPEYISNNSIYELLDMEAGQNA